MEKQAIRSLRDSFHRHADGFAARCEEQNTAPSILAAAIAHRAARYHSNAMRAIDGELRDGTAEELEDLGAW